jgi:hypothetical protein
MAYEILDRTMAQSSHHCWHTWQSFCFIDGMRPICSGVQSCITPDNGLSTALLASNAEGAVAVPHRAAPSDDMSA